MDTASNASEVRDKELVDLLKYVFAGPHVHWRFREWVKKSKITVLSLKGKLEDFIAQQYDLAYIGAALRITGITRLDLSSNNLGMTQEASCIPPDALFEIGTSFTGTSVNSINLSDNRLSIEAVIFFLEGVKVSRIKLEEIDLSDNPIGLRLILPV